MALTSRPITIFYCIFVFFNRYLHICGFPPFAFFPTFYLWARLMTMVICACVGGNDKVLGDEMIEGKIGSIKIDIC